MTFVDRHDEMAALEEEYRRKDASFVVLYGRRRVGKSELLKEFIKGKRALYYLATEESEAENREAFQTIAAEMLDLPILESAPFKRWEDVFQLIAASSPGERTVLVIDEFQYLGKANPAFPSVLQRMWELNGQGAWPFTFLKAGRWWDNHGNEIDVVALDPDEGNIVFGECKYWKGEVGVNVLRDLEEKAKLVEWRKSRRKDWFVLFSVAGFTEELHALAAGRDDVLLLQ